MMISLQVYDRKGKLIQIKAKKGSIESIYPLFKITVISDIAVEQK